MIHRTVSIFGLLCVVTAIALGGCERKRSYSQATPEDVVKSAVAMVKNNDAKQLSNLFYAGSPEERALMDKLGVLFEHLQALSTAAGKRWPEEYAKLQEKAMNAAGEKSPGLLAMLAQGGRGGMGGMGGKPPNPDQAREMFNALLADPYGWLDRNAARLSAIKTSDDTGAVLVDGQPAIPIVGLPMKKDGSKWYVALPTNVPPISNVWPRTRQQWEILGYIVKVVENTVVDLTRAVEAGQVGSIKQLTDKFQERAMFPALLAFAPYGRELDVRGRVDRRVREFQAKMRLWVENRKERSGADAPGVSSKLQQAISSLAPAEIELAVRANKRSRFEEMSIGEFEELVIGWLKGAGLSVNPENELFGESIDKSVEAWTAARKAAQKPKK